MVHIVPLDLRFKGDRTYLQGGDIFNAISAAGVRNFGPDAYLRSIIFRKLAKAGCDVVFDPPASINEQNIGAKFVLNMGNDKLDGVTILTDREVTDRDPYDEETITRLSTIDENNNSVSQTKSAGHSPIEEIISLTKSLHNAILPSKTGKWIFTRIGLTAPLGGASSALYAIELKQKLGARMTVSNIIEGGRDIGKIYFTVLEP